MTRHTSKAAVVHMTKSMAELAIRFSQCLFRIDFQKTRKVHQHEQEVTNLTLNFTNVQIASEGAYQCIVTNLEGTAVSATAALIIDSDRDGIPDSYELAHNWNPNICPLAFPLGIS